VVSDMFTHVIIEQEPIHEFLHDLKRDSDQLRNFQDDPEFENVLKRMRARCDKLRDQYGGPHDLTRVKNYKNARARKRAESQAAKKQKTDRENK